ncbi:hypothetical protein BKA93DRAFT_820168 [Sparassis latifolia]
MLRMALYPASQLHPRTAFTFDVLKYFSIDAIVCNTSASRFYTKMQRLTNNAAPQTVPDRYRELMRVSRQWRDIAVRKWFGFGHDLLKSPGRGELAYFCPACPQPCLNLPENWQEDPEIGVYRRTIVADGNFTLEHMKMRRPENDMPLTNGQGFMVDDVEYQDHLKCSKETIEKSRCANHRAVNQANANRHNLEATGVGACVCARHGCVIPHSVVDFQKGER